ncbi:C-terminal binding protein [Pseudonocardia acaciae]|uniref:C-terminal binding protein n=1 Tax=Pseudonocardia acaciae TaxID=551276 RepID=UPI0006848682|nr:C-terminal binding protein [Pseudonocardia acaciae]
MDKLVVKTDGVLASSPEDIALLTERGIGFREGSYLTEDELIDNCRDADGLLVLREPITARVLGELTRCRVIGRFGVGLDSIDVAAATARGVRVTHVPAANVTEVATHALAMALALARRLPLYDASVRAGRWDFEGPGAGIRRPSRQTFGLVGLGRIGVRVAEAAAAIGFRVTAYDRHLDDAAIRARGVEPVTLDEVIETSDILSLHVPLDEHTRGLVDEAALRRMPPGAVLVNVSRGGLVDEAALAAAIASGHLAGAGLDVFDGEPLDPDSPLRGLDRVILTPHTAHYSADSYAETRRTAFLDVSSVLSGERPRHAVN